MKFKKICAVIAILLCFTQIFCGCGGNTNTEKRQLRIEVRADSDMQAARAVHKKVCGTLSYYLKGELTGAADYTEAYKAVKARLGSISQIASSVLRGNGCGYGATAEIADDALIVRLGTGGGENLSSVLYPLTRDSAAQSDDAVYKSLIAEIIDNI